VLSEIHQNFAWFVIIANGLAGCWVLAANWIEQLRTRAMWWFVAIAEVSVFVQVGLGVGMMAGQGKQPTNFHTFYGFVAIIAVGLIYSYRAQLAHKKYLLYGLGSLFIMGLGIRAMLVGNVT